MIVRSLILLLPLAIWTWLIFGQRLTVRDMTASFLGFVWAFQSSLILNITALELELWRFPITGNLFYQVPVDWLFGQAIITGALVPLTRKWGWRMPTRIYLQALFFLITYFAIEVSPINLPEKSFILLTFALTSVSALFLSDWTAQEKNILGRSLLQSAAWCCLLFWLFPATIFYLTSDDWSQLLQRDWLHNCLLLLPLLLPAYLLGNAVLQFAIVGDGTAFPFDPPKRLVTSGVYRYLSNPMQLGICLGMAWWGVVLESLWVMLSAVVAVLLFLTFKSVCNGSSAIGAGNPEWEIYQQKVPKWWPYRGDQA